MKYLYLSLIVYVLAVAILAQVNPFVLLAFIFITSTIMKAYFPTIKGYIGEERIRNILHKLGEDYTVFNDLYVEKEDGTTAQLDHIVVSRFGIFVIETKNYTGWIFGDEKKRNWTQVIYKKKSRFYNPILQNKNHVKALKEFLCFEGVFHSIIVFSDSAEFKFEQPITTAQVIQNKQLARTVKAYNEPVIDPFSVNRINNELQKLQQRNKQNKKQLKKQHVENINKQLTNKSAPKVKVKKEAEVVNAKNDVVHLEQRIEEKPLIFSLDSEQEPQLIEEATIKQAKTEELKCERCGSELVLRKGKFGQFYGCSSFPKCRYTKEKKVQVKVESSIK